MEGQELSRPAARTARQRAGGVRVPSRALHRVDGGKLADRRRKAGGVATSASFMGACGAGADRAGQGGVPAVRRDHAVPGLGARDEPAGRYLGWQAPRTNGAPSGAADEPWAGGAVAGGRATLVWRIAAEYR
ncbi:MAG: hypothetical protein ACRDYA_03385, partial [Egibacteraceae bacterium]